MLQGIIRWLRGKLDRDPKKPKTINLKVKSAGYGARG